MYSNVESKRLKVLVVDDHPIFRTGISDILNDIDTVERCDEAKNGVEALEAMAKLSYDIVFLDIDMPVMNGIEASTIMKNRYPQSKIIVLTMSNSSNQIIEMLENGVHGYLLKSTDSAELKRAIQLIQEGNLYLTPEVKDAWSKYLVNKASFEKYNPEKIILTPRQKDIIFHICQQQTSQEIAEILFIAEATVNNHRAQIMKKLNTKSVIGIALYAVRSGIFPI